MVPSLAKSFLSPVPMGELSNPVVIGMGHSGRSMQALTPEDTESCGCLLSSEVLLDDSGNLAMWGLCMEPSPVK
tara:strand:+ start:3234 stop:3455 length:222 start_codon:yes stop_codon:yes gene_type:complete